MGRTVPKILQGGGGQTGHGIRLERLLPPALLVLLFGGLLLDTPSARNSPIYARFVLLWFFVSLSSVASISYLCIRKHGKAYILETFAFCLVLTAGLIQFSGYHWLHIVYIPILTALSFAYPSRVIIPLACMVPLIEINHFIYGNRHEEALLSIVTVLTVGAVSTTFSKIRRERDFATKSLTRLREEAEDVDSGTGGVSKEGFVLQCLASANKANEEILEALHIAGHALAADSVSMFAISDNAVTLRCSTGDDRAARITDKGSIELSLKKKTTVISTTGSCVATPVVHGNFVAGVLAAGKSSGKFGSADVQTLEMFARQVAGIIRRQRVHSQMNRDHAGLKVLQEGSSSLTTSLKIGVIARNLIASAFRIAPHPIAFFIARGDCFELIHEMGFPFSDKRPVDVSGTIAGMAVRNGERLYLSDIRNTRIPVLPFKTGQTGSVCMLPLTYGKDVLGLLVVLSEETGALDSYQFELLKVLGNQASSSIANARFHSEMERMAVTDGLTGLFNHRHFQEELSAEFKRLQRFPEPLSLLLVDIDFFKKVNDSYGHPAGDEILRGVAAIIKETVRNIDIPARYGGEEFAAVLLGTNREGARKMAERLRKSVLDSAFMVDGKELKVTVSIGSATSPYDAENKEELIERADRALYEAKKSGRNRCVLWNDIKPDPETERQGDEPAASRIRSGR